VATEVCCFLLEQVGSGAVVTQERCFEVEDTSIWGCREKKEGWWKWMSSIRNNLSPQQMFWRKMYPFHNVCSL